MKSGVTILLSIMGYPTCFSNHFQLIIFLFVCVCVRAHACACVCKNSTNYYILYMENELLNRRLDKVKASILFFFAHFGEKNIQTDKTFTDTSIKDQFYKM